MRSIIALVFVLSVLAPGQCLAAQAAPDSSEVSLAAQAAPDSSEVSLAAQAAPDSSEVSLAAQAAPDSSEVSLAAQADQDSSEVFQEKPFFLPFLGGKARERGYKLPRALGLGVNFIFINRPTEITDVRAGINNTGLNEVSYLGFSALASVRTVMARFDAWVLPFLNIYGLGGYIWNTSRVDVTVDLPGAPGTPISTNGELEGPTFGGGATLAGGYKWFFASADFNITHSYLDELSEFIAGLYSVRLGWNGKLEGQTPVRFYTGAEYWDTKRTISGSIPVEDSVVQTVEFSVDQQPEDPWTVIFGTSVTVSDGFWLVLEYQGWRDTQVLVGQATFRFPK